MPPCPTSGLRVDPEGQKYEGKWLEAVNLFKAKKLGECDAISRWLIDQPARDFHRAGAHLLLSAGPDNYVHHAEKAVELYNKVCDRARGDEEQVAILETFVQRAKRALELAQRDAANPEYYSQEEMEALKRNEDPSEHQAPEYRAPEDEVEDEEGEEDEGEDEDAEEDEEGEDEDAGEVIILDDPPPPRRQCILENDENPGEVLIPGVGYIKKDALESGEPLHVLYTEEWAEENGMAESSTKAAERTADHPSGQPKSSQTAAEED